MRKKSLTNFLLMMSVCLIAGCTTPGEVRLKEQNIPIDEITKAVQANLPAGLRRFTHNGRDFYSNYFVKGKDGEYLPAPTAALRYHAHITILNDRRPYDIVIRIIAERRSRNGQYDQVGQDEGLARVVSRRLHQGLYQRREERNFIDDFRPF